MEETVAALVTVVRMEPAAAAGKEQFMLMQVALLPTPHLQQTMVQEEVLTTVDRLQQQDLVPEAQVRD